jgi:actin-related protein 8
MHAKGADTIVLQLGSQNLRVGFATEQPITVPNVIAYLSSTPPRPTVQPYDAESLFRACNIVQEYLSSVGYLKETKPKILFPKKRSKRKNELQQDEPVPMETECVVDFPFRFTDTSTRPICLIGEDALNIPSSEPYVRHWPILRGHLNVSESQSMQSVLSDLERIIEHTLSRKLRVPRDRFDRISVVLLIPDLFYRYQVRALVDLVLRTLGFRSVFLLQESVAALYGAGVPSACVVDIGAEQVTVTCVDEGVLLPVSVVTQTTAGRSADQLLLKLLRPDSVSSEELRAAEALKIRCSRFIQQDNEDPVTWQPNPVETVRLNSYNAALTISAHSLFHPSLLTIAMPVRKTSLVLHPSLAYDIDDYLEDLAEGRKSEDSVTPVPPEVKPLSLDSLIIKSICAVPSGDIRKKLANQIILSGGGAMIPDIVEVLEDRLINCFPESADIERVEVRVSTTHSDSDGNKETVSALSLKWVGGTVIPMIEAAKELWVTRSRWVGTWDPTLAKEELRVNLMSSDSMVEAAEECRKWRKDRPLEGGVRHIKEKSTFNW